MDKSNKRIVVNTGVVYARLIITTVIGLLSSRYVLIALGASDFGLYSVVGGIISMLNVLSVAMYTTTQRYINVEMGNPDGDLNKIFNISRLLHIGFALFILLIAETAGLFYIYHYLNVAPDRFSDAVFIFQISSIAAAVGIINVPYQALIQANEKFVQLAAIDIFNCVVKFLFIITLLYTDGNTLRLYAIGMSLLTVFSLCFYNVTCRMQWHEIIKYRFYDDKKKYKEILVFNNYVALGATSYLGRTQASNMLVNYFFGTLVNAAFAIGYAIENYCMMFVSNVGSAAAPQIAQNYFSDNKRAVFLTETLNKYTIYLVLLIVVPISLELEFVLRLWLRDVPDGTLLVCYLTLLSALVRVMFGGMDKLIQASGKNKWFQITGSAIQLSVIPVGYVFFRVGFPAYTIVALYIVSTVIGFGAGLFLMRRLLGFNIRTYVAHVYAPVFRVLGMTGLLSFFYLNLRFDTIYEHLGGLILSLLFTSLAIYLVGFENSEKLWFRNIIATRFIKHRQA